MHWRHAVRPEKQRSTIQPIFADIPKHLSFVDPECIHRSLDILAQLMQFQSNINVRCCLRCFKTFVSFYRFLLELSPDMRRLNLIARIQNIFVGSFDGAAVRVDFSAAFFVLGERFLLLVTFSSWPRR